ncbi:hypothetical protein F4781DRAFT_299425 [Annulohypoxylon bovei var. microspora]|nr:hypothetical protein F4781DRAFT_299425 [Annulohypoxylon bovei var. microspora]
MQFVMHTYKYVDRLSRLGTYTYIVAFVPLLSRVALPRLETLLRIKPSPSSRPRRIGNLFVVCKGSVAFSFSFFAVKITRGKREGGHVRLRCDARGWIW